MNACGYAASILISVAGCATVPRDGGFADVQSMVVDRLGQRIAWNRSPTDPATVDAVSKLLRDEVTLARAVQIALLNNRNLQAVYESLGVAQADLVQAGLLRNPTLSAEIRFPPGPAFPFELDVAQNFVDLLFLPARKRAAEAAFAATKLRVTEAVLDLVAQIAERFYTLQAAEQMFAVRRTMLEAAEASYVAAVRLREAGNITDLDLVVQRADYERAKLELAEAEANVEMERERLNALMGLWGAQTQWKPVFGLPPMPAQLVAWRGLESLAVRQRPELGAMRKEWEVQAQQFGVARARAIFPEAEIMAHVEREPEGTTTIGPSVTLPLPIFDQGQAAVSAGQARLREVEQQFFALAVEIRAEVRMAYRQMRAAHRQVEFLQKVMLPLRKAIVAKSLLQYNAMTLNVFDLLQARREELQAELEYIGRLRDYWTARTQLQRAIGGRLQQTEAAAQPVEKEPPPQQQQHHH